MTDFTELLTGVLAEHVLYDGDDSNNVCGCDEVETDDAYYANDQQVTNRWWADHLATVLAPVVARAQAEAWDKGAVARAGDMAAVIGWGVRGHPEAERPESTPNPYRASDIDPTNEGA